MNLQSTGNIIYNAVYRSRSRCLMYFSISFSYKRCGMCWNEWKSIFQFLFFEVSWKLIENWQFLEQKGLARKIKIGNIWNLIFLSIQHIPQLSCKFEQFWKKKYNIFFIQLFKHFRRKKIQFYFWWGALPPTKVHPGPGNFF